MSKPDLRSQRPEPEPARQARAGDLRHHDAGRDRSDVPRGGRRATPVRFHQSNFEGEIVNWIHEAIDDGAGIIINPAALTFTSIAILDALKMFPGPIIELHISNIHRREAYYHQSYVSKVATGVIAGLGPGGYAVAMRAMCDLIRPS